MALTKKYKPGQLVTIYNQVYRVCKAESYISPCSICSRSIGMCKFHEIGCKYAIGFRGYLKLIKL